MKPPIPILLHVDQPRCASEGAGCRMRNRCARALAPAGKNARHDYAAEPNGNTALCEGYLEFGAAREDAGRRYAAAARANLPRSST